MAGRDGYLSLGTIPNSRNPKRDPRNGYAQQKYLKSQAGQQTSSSTADAFAKPMRDDRPCERMSGGLAHRQPRNGGHCSRHSLLNSHRRLRARLGRLGDRFGHNHLACLRPLRGHSLPERKTTRRQLEAPNWLPSLE